MEDELLVNIVIGIIGLFMNLMLFILMPGVW
jgi:hypothetical protein